MYTCCTECRTWFRVDEAQLGAAGGWVRCGQCLEAFDASARLWSEPDEASPQVSPGSQASRTPRGMDRDPADEIGMAGAEPEAGPGPFGEREPDESFELPLDPLEPSPDPYLEGPLEDDRFLPSVSLGEVDIEADLDSAAPGPAVGDVRGLSAARPEARPGPDRIHEGRAASRRRRSREQAILDRIEGRRRRGGRRWAASACIVLVLSFAAQYAWFGAGDLAAAFPVLGPALDRFCEAAGCETQGRAGDGGLRVASPEMRPHAEYSSALSVSAALENRSPEARPFPVVVLILYGRDGRAVASRAFEPAEYLDGGAEPPGGLKPGRRVDIAFDLVAPSEVAVSYSFRLI